MKQQTTLNNISDRIDSIESIIQNNSQLIEKSLNILNEYNFLFSHGINGYREELLKKYNLKEGFNKKEKIYSQIRNDNSLRYPHKKIMEFLIEQYDYGKDRFKEVHFSKIVKECRIGKNKAKEYLDFLIKKGFIESSTDGYRRFYWIKTMIL